MSKSKIDSSQTTIELSNGTRVPVEARPAEPTSVLVHNEPKQKAQQESPAARPPQFQASALGHDYGHYTTWLKMLNRKYGTGQQRKSNRSSSK